MLLFITVSVLMHRCFHVRYTDELQAIPATRPALSDGSKVASTQKIVSFGALVVEMTAFHKNDRNIGAGVCLIGEQRR